MKYNRIKIALFFILIAFFAFSTGCGSSGSGSAGSSSDGEDTDVINAHNTIPTGGSIILAATKSTGAVANGQESYTVVAQVLDSDGYALSEKSIKFSSSGNKGLVAINPVQAMTAADGTVTCTVTDICSTDDTLAIKASCGNFVSVGSIGIAFVGQNVSFPNIGSVRLAAPITTGKAADGEAAYTVTVQVLDKSGYPMSDQSVTFSASENKGLVAINPPVTTTRADGTATCNVSDISQNDDTVAISASCGGVASIGSIGLAFNGTATSGASNVGSIQLAAPITTGKVADGEAAYTVTVQVLDKSGYPMSDQSVTFSASGNKGLVAINPPVTTTQADGTATCNVTDIYKTDDTVIITASCAGILSANSINLVFAESVSESNTETASIVLTANPTSLTADGSSSSAITAVLKDNKGQPVPKGTSVTFTTTLGTFPNGGKTWSTSTSDDSGTLTVSLIAGLTPGTASISCEADNVTQLISIELTGDGLTVSAIDLRPSSTTVSADGFSQIQIVASVKTGDNQAVSGAEVTFKCTRGTITSPHETDTYGRAIAQLTSDRFNDNNVIVTAECQGVTKDTAIVFEGVNVDLEADRTNLLAGEDNFSTITATLKDAAGNPISNADLLIYTTRGEIELINPLISKTDINGKIKFHLSSGTSGLATVTVIHVSKELTDYSAENSIDINFTQYLFTLRTELDTIRVTKSTPVFATLSSSDPGSIKDKSVYFSSSIGTIGTNGLTDESGVAETELVADDEAGVATIDASITIGSETLSASTQLTITGWDATKIVLSASPNVIATTTGESTITAKLFDGNDQPVGDSPVYFRIASGPAGGEYLSASVKRTNSEGIATVKLRAGSLSSILKGVKIEASTNAGFDGNPSFTFLTIAGPVAKIGVGINLHTVEPEGGHLNVDVSALVTDSNGNPVADGSIVNFSVEAIGFDEDRDNDGIIHIWDSEGNRYGEDEYDLSDYTSIKDFDGNEIKKYKFEELGVTWYTDDVNLDGILTRGYDFTESEDINGNGILDIGEDINRNGILDEGEDRNENGKLDGGEDINGNGIIDPVNSCVIGKNISTTNGIAATTLTYLQPHAANIKVRITAESGGLSNFYESILLCTQKMVDNGTCGIAY